MYHCTSIGLCDERKHCILNHTGRNMNKHVFMTGCGHDCTALYIYTAHLLLYGENPLTRAINPNEKHNKNELMHEYILSYPYVHIKGTNITQACMHKHMYMHLHLN